MSRERYASATARIPARITSALARGREIADRRRLAHEAGRVDMERVHPIDTVSYMNGRGTELETFPQSGIIYECKDTRLI